jgi:glycosyltransferase involved in cell wall biosynthesis
LTARAGPAVTPQVSVVIPVLDAAKTLGEQFDGLCAQDFDGSWEVVLADNGSTDETREVALAFRDRLPNLQVVDASARRGINHARNQGATAARGEVLLFCDGDDVVASGWLSTMFRALSAASAAGGALVPLGGTGTHQPTLPASMRTGRRLPPSPLGANCAVRREVWERLGGFDESFDRGAADEVDFFWRLQLEGYSLVAAPEAVVGYRVPHDRRSRLRKVYRIGHERAHLRRKFGRVVCRAPSFGEVLGQWTLILLWAPVAILVESRRERWLKALCAAAGKVAGSFRYRVLYL